jgi:hypothetical protein
MKPITFRKFSEMAEVQAAKATIDLAPNRE